MVSSETGEEAGGVDLRRREVPEFSRRERVSFDMIVHSPVQSKSVILSSRESATGLDVAWSFPGEIQQLPARRSGRLSSDCSVAGGLESERGVKAGPVVSSENLLDRSWHTRG